MRGKTRRGRTFWNGHKGFSMAEVVVATVFIIACVTGIGSFLMYGGLFAQKGQMDSLAAKLATQKIEEVRNLPFYKAWEADKGNQDIDDTYWSYYGTSEPEVIVDPTLEGTPRPNATQFEYPGMIEEEVPGNTNYRRTTAIMYQYMDKDAEGNYQLLDATMNEDWVPKDPDDAAGQDDRPRGGAVATEREYIQSMLVEVKVYYELDGRERSYAKQAIIHERKPEGSILAVTEIIPTEHVLLANRDDNIVTLRVMVDAPGLDEPDEEGQPQSVKFDLWYPGQTDIKGYGAITWNSGQGKYVGTGKPTIDPSGASWIEAKFNLNVLPDGTAREGRYNVAVTWENKGFVNRKFRNNFSLVIEEPQIDTVTAYDWGYRHLDTDRQVTVNGFNLSGAYAVDLYREGSTDIRTRNITVDNNKKLVAYFTLNGTEAERPNGSVWGVRVFRNNADGESLDGEKADVFTMNPAPVMDTVTLESPMEVPNSYGLDIAGNYFQSRPTKTKVYLVKGASGASTPAANAVYVKVPDTNVLVEEGYTSTTLSAALELLPDNFKVWPGETVAPRAQIAGQYHIMIENQDGQRAKVSGSPYQVVVNSYTISTAVNPSGWGTATGGGVYIGGENCTVVATPADGRHFQMWTEEGVVVNGGQSYTFMVNRDRTLTANFRRVKLYWNSWGNPDANQASFVQGYTNDGHNGNVFETTMTNDGSGAGADPYGLHMRGSAWYDWGDGERTWVTNEEVNFTRVDRVRIIWRQTWDGPGQARLALSHNKNSNYGADIVRNISHEGFGYTVESMNTADLTDNYYIRVHAKRNPGLFDRASTVRVYKMWLEPPIHYNVTATTNNPAGGSVSLRDSANRVEDWYAEGNTCTAIATPAAGYNFVNWTVGGSQVSTSATYPFSVTANRALVANFALKTYTISVSASPAGGGSVSGGGTYTHFSTCTVIANASPYWKFVNWTEGGVQQSTSASYSFTVDRNRTLVANFRNSFTISVSATPSGFGAVSGGGTYTGGTTCTVVATPNSGYGFARWTEGGSTVSTSASYAFTVTDDRTLVGNFRRVKLYWNSYGNPAANVASFVQGYTNNGHNGNVFETTMTNDGSGAGADPYGLHMRGSAWYDWGDGERTWVTNAANDLTGVDRIRIIWRQTWDGPGIARLVVSGNKNSAYDDDNVRNINHESFGYTVESMNTADISGSYYIRVHAKRNPGLFDRASTARVYKMWLEPPIHYNVTASENPGVGGSTVVRDSAARDEDWFASGDSCTAIATPATGYNFVNWTVGGSQVSTSPTYTFNVTANRALQANFALKTYTINVSASPSGGGSVTGGGVYQHFSTCSVSATASLYWKFVNWTEGGIQQSTNTSYSFTVDRNRNLVANFRNTYTISVSANPSAYGSVSGGGTYTGGTTCTVVATPGTAYAFARWTEGGSTVSASASYSFTVTDDRNLVAHFRVKRVYWNGTETVPINSGYTGDGGTDRTKGGTYLYLHAYDWWLKCQIAWSTNSPVDLTGVSRIAIQWRNTDSNDGNNESYLIAATNSGDLQEDQSTKFKRTGSFGTRIDYLDVSGINEPRYIRVHARDNAILSSVGSAIYIYKIWLEPPNCYQIDVGTATTPSGDTGGTASGAEIYETGDSCTVTASANSGYRFVNWTEGGTQQSTSASYTFTVGANRTLVANFIRRHTITVSASTTPSGDNGGTASGAGTWDYGTSRTVTASANSGYRFVNWTEGGSQVSASTSYTFTLTSNRNLVANFLRGHTISVSASPSAGGSVSGGGGYDYGASCTVIATANTGSYYHFVNWTEGGTQQSTSASYTFTVYNNRTLVANFSNTYTISVSANPSAYGSVSGGGTYTGGNNCTVTATAGTAYAFARWTVGGSQVSTSASYTFMVTGDRTLVAQFRVKRIYWNGTENVPINSGYTGDGGTSRSKGGSYLYLHAYDWWLKCQIAWSTNSPVDLTGVSRVAIQWQNNDSNDGNNESYLIAATNSSDLQEDQSTKFSRTGSFGTRIDYLDVSGINEPRYIRVHSRDNAVMSSVGSTIYIYKIWLEPPAHYQIDVGTATTPSGDTGGTASGAEIYETGDSCTVTASANSGYAFVNWTEGGTQQSTSTSYTFTVGSNRTLVANFIRRHTITVSQSTSGGGTGGTVSGGGTYNYGAWCTVTASVNSNYRFVNWTEGGSQVSTSTSYGFTVTGNRTLVANFVRRYTISTSSNPAAGGSTSGGGTYDYGAWCTVTASANPPAYSFLRWTEGGSQVSTSASYGFTVTGDRTLVAQFQIASYTISAVDTSNVEGTAGGSTSGDGTYDYGSTCTLTASPASYYSWLGWTEGGRWAENETGIFSTSTSYSWTVTGPRTIYANFRLTNYVYYVGSQRVPMGGGYTSDGDTSRAYQADRLYLYSNNYWGARISFATTPRIHMRGVSNVWVYWTNNGYNDSNNRSIFQTSTNRDGNEDSGTINGNDQRTGTFGWYWQNISPGVNDWRYIRVFARNHYRAWGTRLSRVYVYQMYLAY